MKPREKRKRTIGLSGVWLQRSSSGILHCLCAFSKSLGIYCCVRASNSSSFIVAILVTPAILYMDPELGKIVLLPCLENVLLVWEDHPFPPGDSIGRDAFKGVSRTGNFLLGDPSSLIPRGQWGDGVPGRLQLSPGYLQLCRVGFKF